MSPGIKNGQSFLSASDSDSPRFLPHFFLADGLCTGACTLAPTPRGKLSSLLWKLSCKNHVRFSSNLIDHFTDQMLGVQLFISWPGFLLLSQGTFGPNSCRDSWRGTYNWEVPPPSPPPQEPHTFMGFFLFSFAPTIGAPKQCKIANSSYSDVTSLLV